MTILALLLTALLFGGMTLFSFGFAPVLFAQLPETQVRPLLRGTFPHYYLVVTALSALTALVAAFVSVPAAILVAAICVTTIYARQILMPRINAASDAGDGRAFALRHGGSVVLQLVQIGLAAWALLLLA
ncbi:MAG: DUF4149 domain-containing protein [Pseudomonadota bacterium]